MKRALLLLISFLLITVGIVFGAEVRWIKVGNVWTKGVDSANEGESAPRAPNRYFLFHNYHRYVNEQMHALGWYVGVRDWTDENGQTFPAKINGAAHGTSNEQVNTIPVPDADGLTIHRYYRYQPPEVEIDGLFSNDPFPLLGDEVAPEKIPGTADIMVESFINTSMGLTVHQKVLAWSQKYHDDYIVHDLVLKNTGNTDADEAIELPTQVLNDLHFMRVDFFEHNPGSRDEWIATYGALTTDTLRMMYNYPTRTRDNNYDNTGNVHPETNFLQNPLFVGEAWLHVDSDVGNPVDNFNYPDVTGIDDIDNAWSKRESHSISQTDNEICYNVMRDGWSTIPDDVSKIGDMTGPDVRTGTVDNPVHHSIPMDQRGVAYGKDFSWFSWLPGAHMAAGPWTLQPGDSIRIVTARVLGTISIEEGWRIGQEWNAGTLTWNGPDNLPAPFASYLDNEMDRAKDNWVFTGKDSLFASANAAQWAVRNNYNVPLPPPPPASVKVTSQANQIVVTWDREQPENTDPNNRAVGYRVYRSIGRPDPEVVEGQLVGGWQMVFECGQGTSNAITDTYNDTQAARGQNYYYYVTAVDDGSNNVGVDGIDRGVLESGKYVTRTTLPASLLRAPGQSLSDIRVVPNPLNINDIQFTGAANKITFLNVPPICTIKIYTLAGDLVTVLEHTDTSGDQPWGVLDDEQMLSGSGQRVTSGLYIAHIETPEGESTVVKFAIVR